MNTQRSFDDLQRAIHLATVQEDVDSIIACACELEHSQEILAHALAMESRGWLAYLKGDPCRARQCLCDALVLYERLGDKTGMAHVIDRLGSVSQYEQRHERALDYFQRASDIHRSLGDHRSSGDVMVRMADIYVALDHPNLALKTCIEAHACFVAAGVDEVAEALAVRISDLHERTMSSGL